MADRDAYFIEIFDKILENEGSSIHTLLDWCLWNNESRVVDQETIRLSGIMISLFLISSNRPLRDKATKSLVKLLTGHLDILIEILKSFEDADDPYILERLYSVAFGCTVSESSDTQIKKIGIFVYNAIFCNEVVYPNILLRDYAKNIIDYVVYRLGNSNFDMSKVTPPYRSKFPAIPSDGIIQRYKYDNKHKDFKEYYWSQNAILDSMRVEYSRDGSSGGHGDFGRYTFQSYFSDWKQLNANDLENIAIKKIFDMGYDVEKHGEYDRNITRSRHGTTGKERIGKKYQWIALYELAAQVSDNYKIETYVDDHGTKEQIYCKGSFKPNIRDIDPTISLVFGKAEEEKNKPIHNRLYQISREPNMKWLADFHDAPKVEAMLNLQHDGREFTLLNGWYSWREKKIFGVKLYENPQKEMWFLTNGYIIKKSDKEHFINALQKADFMGRWLPEPHANYAIYNKEYYWSEGFDFFDNPYYCGEEWVNMTLRNSSRTTIGKVLLPTFKYATE